MCHVFAVTSDSLFIERVYNEAKLQGRWLDKHAFSEEEKELTWNYVRGKPVYLVELVNSEKIAEKMEEMLKNILFVEPLRKKIRPQSRLDLLAMREVTKNKL